MARTVISALPAAVDLRIYQGDDFTFTVTVSDPDTGEVLDLTGLLPEAQLRASPTDEEILAEFDADILDNVIVLHLHHADSAALAGSCFWDVQLTDADGSIVTVAYGMVSVTNEVTRS